LRSGAVATTIDGQTTERLPGDYWTVKAGANLVGADEILVADITAA
jgi:hypothetical protein